MSLMMPYTGFLEYKTFRQKMKRIQDIWGKLNLMEYGTFRLDKMGYTVGKLLIFVTGINRIAKNKRDVVNSDPPPPLPHRLVMGPLSLRDDSLTLLNTIHVIWLKIY